MVEGKLAADNLIYGFKLQRSDYRVAPSVVFALYKNKIIPSETRWRIEGKDGAAAILGLHPSALRARMNKLGTFRPEAKEPD
jgi:hypothetical protein